MAIDPVLPEIIDPIIIGALGSVISATTIHELDKHKDSPDPPDPSYHLPCIHRDLHTIRDHISLRRPDIMATIVVPVYPQTIAPKRHDRHHTYVYASSPAILTATVAGTSKANIALGVGWNVLDFPEATALSTEAGGAALTLLYVATDRIIPNVANVKAIQTVLYSQTMTINAGGYSSPIQASSFDNLTVLVNILTLTGGGSVQFGVDYIDPMGNKYDVGDTNSITSAPTYRLISYGIGMTYNILPTDFVTLHWFLTGTSPSCTFQITLIGR